MSIIVILKNTTGGDLTYNGRVILAGGQTDGAGASELFRENEALLAAIDAGDIIVNDGTSDLNTSRGKAHLFAPMFGEVEHELHGLVNTVSGTIVTITSTENIPLDNSTPLITEGTEIVSLAITPLTSANRIKVDAVFTISRGIAGPADKAMIASVFRDTVCVASFVYNVRTRLEHTVVIKTVDSPNVSSETTYSIRVGCSSGTGEWHINRNDANETLGGTRVHEQFVLTELK